NGTHGKITGRELALQSKAVAVYGWLAVPELVNWVDHDDPAVRYIAANALIMITEEKPAFRFHQDGALKGDEPWVRNAKARWLDWFEKLTSGSKKPKSDSNGRE
ncbi:MAG: HEAT repeat domain-containing protein, partial [Verrucomicrobiota bacterium]